MQHSTTPYPATSEDIMQVWAQCARAQRAAFDALAAYIRQL